MTESSELSRNDGAGRWRRNVDRWRRRLWWLATLVGLLVAVYVVVARELMSLVPDLRPRLEAMLTERVGTPVTIAALEGRMEGLSPVFEMRGLRLEPEDDALAPLHVRRSELTVDLLPTLMHRRLRARQLLVEGVRVALVRQEDGKIVLRGLEALTRSENRSDPKPLLDLLYRQKRLVVNELDLTLDWPQTPSLHFPDVEIALVSSGERHLLSARGRSLAEPMEFDLRLRLNQDAYRFEDLSGEGYVRVQGAGFAPWLAPLLEDRPLSVSRVGGRLQMWARLAGGELQKATAKLGLAAVELEGEGLSEPWRLDRTDLLVRLNRHNEGYQAFLSRAELQDEQGTLTLPGVLLDWAPGGDNENGAAPWSVRVLDADIRPLHQWLARQPLQWQPSQKQVLERLASLQPTGEISHLDVQGQGKTVRGFAARFRGIGVTAVDKTPGVRGLAGWVAGSPDEGVARIDSTDLGVSLPNLYANPLAAALQGPLAWHHANEETDVTTGWLQVDNPDARGRLLATVRMRPDRVPNLSLLASLTEGKGNNVAEYIPLRRLPDGASNWLAQAFSGGSVPEGRFLHEGPVKIDPDRQQDRTLQMAFRVRDLTLSYLPGWPALSAVNGDVMIDGRAIHGRGISARLQDSLLTDVVADIPEYENEEVPTVIVSGKLDGEAKDVTTVLHDTPLRDALPEEVGRWDLASGKVAGHLLLHWPLPPDAPGKVFIANTRLSEGELVSGERGLAFSQVNGPVFFHLDRGMFSDSLEGNFWDGNFRVGMTTSDGQLSVTGEGDATVPSALDWLGQKPGALASGRFDYRAALILPWREEGDGFLELSSDLLDVELAMPAPLAKPAGEALATRIRVDLLETPLVSVFSDPLLRARIRPGKDGIEAADLVFGGLAPVLPESGIRIRGDLAQLAVEPWIDWLDARPEGDGDVKLRNINLSVAALDLLDFPVTGARLKARPVGEDWRFELDSEQLAGSLLLPDRFQLRGNRPMVIDVTRLILEGGNEQASSLDPLALPVANVSASGMQVDGEDFGSWKMKWRPQADGMVLEDIDANWRAAHFSGDARWTVTGGIQRTHYTGRVVSGDLASALRAWEVPTIIESKRATAVIDLDWQGSPLDLDYLDTEGTVSIHVKDALIPNSDSRTNALRMLGIFNVNAVSRRLRLDFSDVYKKGLSCDEISGDFTVEGPLVTTRNLVLDSPSAEFRISGSTNLDTEELQQQVDVTLPTSSSLYLGCFAGPAACAGVFVVERLWGNKLEKMLSLSYSVTGSWNDPKVKEMERNN